MTKDLENEYDNGFEDGVEQAEKEVEEQRKRLVSMIESKMTTVPAYSQIPQGPPLTNYFLIPQDDWFLIKRQKLSELRKTELLVQPTQPTK